MKISAGTLLYKMSQGALEVLLVHPSGNYNRKAPWGIPKGELKEDEDLERTARRETIEETGVMPGRLTPLGEMQYTKSRKKVYCFTGEVPADTNPCCSSWEVDRAEFLPIGQAADLIHPDQKVFLDRLEQHLFGS